MTEKLYNNENLDDSKNESKDNKPLSEKGMASMSGDPNSFISVDDKKVYEEIESDSLDPDKSNKEKYKDLGEKFNKMSKKEQDFLRHRGFIHNGKTEILGPDGKVITFDSKNQTEEEE